MVPTIPSTQVDMSTYSVSTTAVWLVLLVIVVSFAYVIWWIVAR